MKRVILSNEWENDALNRQKAIEEMQKAPFTLDELIEQQRCNDNIHQEDFLRVKILKNNTK